MIDKYTLYLLILFLHSSLLIGQYRRTFRVDNSVNYQARKDQISDREQKIGRSLFFRKPIAKDNDIEAAKVSRIDLIRDQGLTLKGTNLSAAMWETGNAITTHADFYDNQPSKQTRIEQPGNAAHESNHATAVAGIIMGSGKNDKKAEGMAPEAKVRSYNIQYSYKNLLEFINTYIDEVRGEILSRKSLIGNNSWDFPSGYDNSDSSPTWGEESQAKDFKMTEDYIFGFYGIFDEAIDRLLNENEYYTIVFSAGNDKGEEYSNILDEKGNPYPKDCASGYDCISWTHGGKNIITVGAVNEAKTVVKTSDISVSDFSSVGPMDDGRIKPDIVSVGTNMYTTRLNGKYVIANGTSFAAPVVTGGALLIQQYSSQKLGHPLLGFTLKGLICNTAGHLGSYLGPDYQYGWGLFDAKGATDFITDLNSSSFMLEDSLNNHQRKTLYFIPEKDRISATLSWYDPEGTPVYDFKGSDKEVAETIMKNPGLILNNRTPSLVNDLDLRLENAGVTFKPWTLNVNQPSNPAVRGDDSINNIEGVYINTGELKKSVIKATVSHKGNLKDGKPEHFALLINGVQECNVYSKKDDGTTGWDTPLNGSDKCLVIDAPDYIIDKDTSFSCTLFGIADGVNFTINSGVTLTIDGHLDNSGNIVVKPGGKLQVK